MQRTIAPGHVNNLFVPEDANAGIPPSQVSAAWLNQVQEEIANAIVMSGIALNAADKSQLYKAISRIASGSNSAFLAHGPDIVDAADLNDYVSLGVYHQNLNSFATNGTHYPVGLAGMLEVFSDGQMVYQRYTTYNAPQKIYTRARYTGTWLAWSQQWSSTNDGAGSGLDADKLDGKHAAEFISVATLEAAFNANDPVGTKKYVNSAASIADCRVICDGRNYTVSGVVHAAPDLRDSFIISTAAPGGFAITTGNFYGDNDAVVVAHSHGITDPGHFHTIGDQSNSDNGANKVAVGGDGPEGINPITDLKVTGIYVNSAGVNGANKNVPRAYAQIIVMKYRLYVLGD